MTEERVQRRLAAILAADVVGYSRLMEANEAGTRAQFNENLDTNIRPAIEDHGGRLVKTMGDGFLVEFSSVVEAVECATDIQNAVASQEGDRPEERRMQFRIGIHLGDVIVEGDDIHGDGVNIASRLESLAEAGGICISGMVHTGVRRNTNVSFIDLGEQKLKNISDPVHVFRITEVRNTETVEKPAVAASVLNLPSIAVLPFENLSDDAEQEYFSEGITEDLITALSHVRRFHVIARNSTLACKNLSPDVRRIAKELNARYVVEGSVRKAGKRIRLTAQLIDGASGNHIWVERYDRELEDIFAVQDELTAKLVGAIAPSVSAVEQDRARMKPSSSLDAWDLYQRGMWQLRKRNRTNLDEAEALFNQALQFDTDFAAAHTGLARTLFYRSLYGHDEPDIERAFDAARRAVELDGKDAETHCALSRVHNVKREHQAAISEAQTAIALNPSLADAYHMLGSALLHSGNAPDAVAELETAIQLSPHHELIGQFHGRLALANLYLGKYGIARELAEKAVRFQTSQWTDYIFLISALGHLELRSEAEKYLNEVLSKKPNISVSFVSKFVPTSDKEQLECLLAGLRKVGMPEETSDTGEPLALPDKPSIAVLPFDNMSADPEQEYFSDGITEDIITELSKISGLFVIARHSAFTYKGRSITLKQVGAELGVRYALEGSVRKAGNRLRITAQLIDAESDQHLWAERYDRDFADIFAIQEEVANNVAQALTVTLKPTERDQLAHAPTQSLEAYELYMRARGRTWPPTKDNILSARNAYSKVIAVDGIFAGGYAGKSMTYSLAVLFGHSEDPDGEAQIAMELANRAIEIDPKFARSYSALGSALTASGRHEEAIAASRAAIELQPGDADSHEIYGRCLMFAGNGAEACNEIHTALRLDPQYVEGPYLNFLGRAAFIASRFDETIAAFEQNLARGGPLSPPAPPARAAAACALVGRMEDARRILDDYVLRFDSNFTLKKMKEQILARFNIGDEVKKLIDGLRKAGLPE